MLTRLLRTVDISKRVATWIAVIALIAAVAVTSGAATVYSISRVTGGSQNGNMWPKVRWRAALYLRKTKGALPDLSWSEVWQMTRQRGGFGLEGVVIGRSIEGSINNPFTTDDDHRAGLQLYRDHCATCHGGDGSGWHAPPLNRRGLRHGDSDLAIYRVLRDGIAGTAMVPVPMTLPQRWQVVGFVRSLQLRSSHQEGGARRGPDAEINVTADRVLAAGSRTDEWITYSGSLDGRRYSKLAEVSRANVAQLKLRWVQQLDSTEPVFEATPLVINGVMFTTTPPSSVVALDARTGDVLWRYRRDVPDSVGVCCGRVNRGLAVLGSSLFLGTLDGYLVSLDANNGAVKWQIPVATSQGYSITGAPLIVNDTVIVGISGGEFGIRGFLVAYDAATGREKWKFYTIPGPGEPGHETWQNEAWQTGGAPTWITGTYDPELDLLYWGVGNPGPDFAGDVRPGDNLYSDSVIALHPSTGKLAWHFQFTPHDDHDWDSNQTPILTDLTIGGTKRKVMLWANRNGYYFVLDRVTGKFIAGTPFVELNWAKGLDANGRPIPAERSNTTSDGRLTKPGVGGGTNWQNPAYDPQQSLVFVHAVESTSVFTAAHDVTRGDNGIFVGSAGAMTDPPLPVVRALDAATGTRKWERYSAPLRESGTDYSGLLATAGGLVFGQSGGFAFALDSSTGQEMWQVMLGGDTRATPITFTLDGKQVVAITAGRSVFLFGL
jgi:alcohol dehydrogenase (cytochrome c)